MASESVSYHDTILGRVWEGGEEGTWRLLYVYVVGGGFAFAVQLHREVRPESGLVGIVEHIEVNKR